MLTWIRQGALILLLGIAPILLLEGGLRLAGWPTQRVRTLGKLINHDPEVFAASVGMFKPNAASRVAWPPELAYDVRINSLGLRGAEVGRAPTPGRVRVLALGDSMTFGFYLEEDETWPAQLEQRLRAAGRDVEVINAGVGGYGIPSETRFLEERGLGLDPDIVVLAFCANDIRDLDRPHQTYEGQKRALGSGGKGPLREAAYRTASYELFLRWKVWSKRYRQKLRGEEPHPLSSFDVPEERLPVLWADYGRWLDRMQALLAERDIPLAVVYIPDAYKLAHGVPATDEARLRAAAEERGIWFGSPLAAFEPLPVEETFHVPIDPHIGPRGAALLADAVGDLLLREAPVLGGAAATARR